MIWAWPSKSHSQSHVVIYFPPSHLSPTPPLPSSRHSTPLMSPKEMLPCQKLPCPLADGRPSEPLAHLALLSAALTWSFHGDGTCSHKLWLVARTDNNQTPSSCTCNPRGREMLTGAGVLLPFSPLTRHSAWSAMLLGAIPQAWTTKGFLDSAMTFLGLPSHTSCVTQSQSHPLGAFLKQMWYQVGLEGFEMPAPGILLV